MATLFLIAGPCAVESKDHILDIASRLKKLGVDALRGGSRWTNH